MRRITALAAALVGVLAGLVLYAAPASAHATLVTSTPGDGARLKSAPASVSITFDEPVSISYFHVIDPSGDRVEAGTPTHPGGDGTKIAVNLRPGLGDGTYVESWRVISADSHPVAGTVRFVVGNGPLAASTVDVSTVNRLTSVVFDAVRWVSYAGLALLGGVWLLLTVWPAGRVERRARRLVWLGWAALTAGTAAELLVQGPYAAGQGLGGLFNASSLNTTLHGTYGQYHSARLLLLGLLALVLGRALAAARRRVEGRAGRRAAAGGHRSDVLDDRPPRHDQPALAVGAGGRPAPVRDGYLGRRPGDAARRGAAVARARGCGGRRRATRRSCGGCCPSSRGWRSCR